MTTEEAFLAAIREAPDDDAPRLVFADWLEDNGDPDRAEFIRLQVAQARKAPGAGRRRERIDELHGRHREEWLAPLRALLGPEAEAWMRPGPYLSPENFPRGFVSSLTMTARRFLACAGELFRLAPLAHLRLKGAAYLGEQLAACRELGWVRAVSFVDYFMAPVGAAEMAQLARSPWLAGWRHLGLYRNNLGDEGAVALASAPWLPGLLSLNLADNGLSPRGVEALADADRGFRPRALTLSVNPVGDGAVARLVASPVASRLESLALAGCDLSDRAALALAGSPHLDNLRALDLSGNPGLTEAGRSGLERSALWARLRKVDTRAG